MNVNFAERAHNHNWKLDPIVRSLLDTDFYKLLMLQFIWKNFSKTQVTSEIHNRTTHIRLADRISASALRDQLDHVRTLRLRRSELVWLAGNTFYGVKQIFHPDFLAWLDREAPRGKLTEIDAVAALESFRRDTGRLKDISFPTIAGAGPDGGLRVSPRLCWTATSHIITRGSFR